MALVVGCGDDETSGITSSSSSSSSVTGSGGAGGSSGSGDGGSGGSIDTTGSGGQGGGGHGGGSASLEGAAKVVALSASGADAFYGVAYAADGSFYAAGFAAEGPETSSDRSMVVAKFTAAGDLDTSFGDAGIAKKNVAVGGAAGETARAVIVQSTGKIVIGGTVEADVAAAGTAAQDRDIALVRFNADGTIDDTFGAAGVQLLDLSAGVEVSGSGGPTLSGADSMWSLSVTSDDKILVHGTKRAGGTVDGSAGPRPDSDWAVVRVKADGGLDETFGVAGVFSFDIDQVAGQARTGTLLADGSFIGAGYANTPSLGSQQPVVYKVDTQGKLDTTFGAAGVFHDTVLPALAEAYAAQPQGDKLVTAGYGRKTSTDVIGWLSIRLTATGQLDPTYGSDGVVQLTLEERSNARGLVILPDQRPLLFGGGSRIADKTEATVAVLEADGAFDATYGSGGVKSYDLGGTADVFWAGAVSPDQSKVAIVGLKGVAAADASAASNDDAAVLVLSIGE